MMGTKADEDPKSRRSRRWWSIAGLFMIAGVFFVAASPYLDTLAIETVRCEVVSAEPRTASGGSRGSVSTSEVLVNTSNCGEIVVDEGVNSKNQEEVASSFAVGSEYEFDMGWYSRVVMKNEYGKLPSVQDYRLVN